MPIFFCGKHKNLQQSLYTGKVSLGSLVTTGAGAAVVSMPGGAGVVTPNVTVMIVIFTLDVILCFVALSFYVIVLPSSII